MRNLKLLKTAGILAFSAGYPAFSQVVNHPGVYENVTSCAAYQRFLNEDEFSEQALSECGPKTTFLLEGEGQLISSFLREYSDKTEENSPLFNLASALISVVRSFTIESEHTRAYFLLDAAGLDLNSAFARGGDFERAVMYSVLITGAKNQMLLRDLQENSQIATEIMRGNLRIVDVLGTEFGLVDSRTPSFALICLLRADNFRVNLSEVLLSDRMKTCLSETS